MRHRIAAGPDHFFYLVDCEGLSLTLAMDYEMAVRAYRAEIPY
ncbi:MAG: hypothetical protein WC993_07965 [Methanoculleus sp.]